MLFPRARGAGTRTAISLVAVEGALPLVTWLGETERPGEVEDPDGFVAARHGPGIPLLGEHARGRYSRPHLRGHRLVTGSTGVSGAPGWTTWFRPVHEEVGEDRYVLHAEDPAAGLALVYELESVPGGALRGRATVTNTAPGDYVLDGLEVVLPLPDDHVDLLDFTGRHERERSPQRHPVEDGLWLREGRGGRPGLDAATMVVAGTAGFSTTHGHVVGVHVAWSGGSVLRVERSAAHGATLGGGERLLPGEVVLPTGASYASPWVFFAAARDGLDGLAARWHGYQRSLAAHPRPPAGGAQRLGGGVLRPRPPPARGDRAARLRGSAWSGSCSTTAGSTTGATTPPASATGSSTSRCGPRVSTRSSTTSVGSGMEFGLWFEPEMVNPDSDLFREHPEWILSAGGRAPLRAPAPAGARPDPARGHSTTSSTGCTWCSRSTPSTT